MIYNIRGHVYYIDKGEIDRAIEDFNKAIELNPEFDIAYNNRGVACIGKGEFDRAIEDYSKAIELNQDYAEAYYNRGETWLCLEEWEKAKSDLTVAKDLGADIIVGFSHDYKNVEEFEQRHDVKLPKAIAAMLTQQ